MFLISFLNIPILWRHNGRDGVSNHQPHDCLLNRLFKAQIKETSKLRVTGLCGENSTVTGEFPAQRVSNAENVSIWWRHHASFNQRHHTNDDIFPIWIVVTSKITGDLWGGSADYGYVALMFYLVLPWTSCLSDSPVVNYWREGLNNQLTLLHCIDLCTIHNMIPVKWHDIEQVLVGYVCLRVTFSC